MVQPKITLSIDETRRRCRYEYYFSDEKGFYCSFWQFFLPEEGWGRVCFSVSSIQNFTLEEAQIALEIQSQALKDMENSQLIFEGGNTTAAVLGTPHKR